MESQASPWNPVGTEAAHSSWEQTVSTAAIKSNSTESSSLLFPKASPSIYESCYCNIDEDDTIRFA